MADSTPEPERIAEILREIIALSQTGRRSKPHKDSADPVETGEDNPREPTSSSDAHRNGFVCNRQPEI